MEDFFNKGTIDILVLLISGGVAFHGVALMYMSFKKAVVSDVLEVLRVQDPRADLAEDISDLSEGFAEAIGKAIARERNRDATNTQVAYTVQTK